MAASESAATSSTHCPSSTSRPASSKPAARSAVCASQLARRRRHRATPSAFASGPAGMIRWSATNIAPPPQVGGASGEPSGAEQIGHDARVLAGPHAAGATEAGEDLVGDQEHPRVVAGPSQAAEQRGREEAHAVGPEDERLDDERRDGLAVSLEGRLEGVAERLPARRVARDLAVRAHVIPEEQRLEDLGEVVDRADAHRADGVAMVGAGEREEARASRPAVAATIVLCGVLERDLQRDLDGGAAVVAVEDAREGAIPLGGDPDELGGGRVRRHRQRYVGEGARLGLERRDEARMREAEDLRPPGARGVEVAAAVEVDEPRTLGRCHDQIVPLGVALVRGEGPPDVRPIEGQNSGALVHGWPSHGWNSTRSGFIRRLHLIFLRLKEEKMRKKPTNPDYKSIPMNKDSLVSIRDSSNYGPELYVQGHVGPSNVAEFIRGILNSFECHELRLVDAAVAIPSRTSTDDDALRTVLMARDGETTISAARRWVKLAKDRGLVLQKIETQANDGIRLHTNNE